MEKKELIKKLKEKKELKDIDISFISHRIDEYIKDNNLEEKFNSLGFFRTSSYKKMFKDLRKKLREVYGIFRAKSFMENPSIKERLVYYKEIYYKIFSITGKPKKILDLGCGLNPLSYEYLGCKPHYYACDISKEDVKKVKEFFKKKKINGEAFDFNLVDGNYSKLPKVNVCFLFKTLESLEQIKRDISGPILKSLDCDWIAVSFSRKSMTGKRIKKSGRAWFRSVLKKLKLYYRVFDVGNEMFFIIKKE